MRSAFLSTRVFAVVWVLTGLSWSQESLVENGQFRSGLKGWEIYGNAGKVFSMVTEGGLTFARYERTSETPADNYHLDQKLSLEPDANYTLTLRYRCGAGLKPVLAFATADYKQFSVKALTPSEAWTNATLDLYSGNEKTLRLQIFAGAKGKIREALEGRADFTAISLEKKSAGESGARLVYDLEKTGPVIPKNFTGVNTLFWLETREDLADGRIAEWIRRSQIGYLRYPGGTAGQNFDWRTKQVLDPKRWPGEAKGVTYLDTDGFVSLCQKTGAKPFVVLNLAGMFLKTDKPDALARKETIQRAASWAAKFKESGVKVACYELGNEHYLEDQHSKYVEMKVRDYVSLARDVIAAVRAADGEAAFGAVGPGGFDDPGYSDRAEAVKWWPTVLGALGAELSHVILHHYWQGGAYSMAQIDYGEELSVFRQKLLSFGGGKEPRFSEMKIGYTEWGGSQYASPKEYALFASEALSSFIKNGADFAIQWPLRKFGVEWSNSQLLSGAESLPAGDALAVWGNELCGRPRLIPGEKSFLPHGVFATAVRTEKGLALFAGNRSSVNTVSLALEIRGLAPKTIRLTELGQGRSPVQAWHSGEAVVLPKQNLVLIEVE